MNESAEFRHFRYLLAIIEQGGFRAAAEHLHTAQPNLSEQARQFQDLLNIHLFRRRKDGRVSLTKTGVAFGPLAHGLLDARDEVIAALIAIEREEIRNLKLGSTSLIDQALFHACCQIHKQILPDCPIFPTHGDMPQLEEELASGEIDAALVTLPVTNPCLSVQVIRRDPLVVCLRRDHPLASKSVLEPSDLQNNLRILYHPDRHFHAHQRHRKYLREIGIEIEHYSRANHPVELRELVKQGYGFALVREGSKIDDELTTRRVAGVDWHVSIAVIYNSQRHPRTIPVLVRHLKRYLSAVKGNGNLRAASTPHDSNDVGLKRPPGSEGKRPMQMSLLG